jgi:hypothetical protein
LLANREAADALVNNQSHVRGRVGSGGRRGGRLIAGVTIVQAQTYPTKPVRIICTFAAGGTTDVLARGLARQLSEIWGQQVVVENRAGANTQIGAEHVAKSAGDGYTLMVTSEGTFVMKPSLYEKLPYDAATTSSRSPNWSRTSRVLIVSPKVPVITSKADRTCPQATRQADLRHDRPRLVLASQHGDAAEHGAGEADRRALPRRVAGAGRCMVATST